MIAVVMTSLVVWPSSALATTGADDYPPRLKRAAQDSLVDPWLFYNRECTSFVAWRLNNDAGVAFTNYYLGEHWGDASNWKHAAVQAGVTVNDNPAVGAVAWWRAGSAGSSLGHVAWVESVSSTAITVEEYNYYDRGNYDTRTIDSGSDVWPSAFIHIGDISIRNSTAPTITGTAQVGSRLTATRGAWKPAGATFTYQWLADGTPISGATHKTFTPRAGQLATNVQVMVTAVKPGLKPATAWSARTARVKRGVFTTSLGPSVAGTPQVGVQLSASPGSWSPQATFHYRWFAGRDPVAGATDRVFTPSAAKLGKQMGVRVTATRPGYRRAVRWSEPTEQVRPGVFANDKPPSIDGFAQVGNVLTANEGEWSPKGAESFQWLVDGVPVDGATSPTYKPGAADVRAEVAVQVTVERAGYTTAIASSAPTDPVAPGSFVNTREAAIVGRPQVGRLLTADPGGWSPKAAFAYQWFLDGVPIGGADEQTYRPRPEDLGATITVQVTASRPGYTTALVTTGPTAGIAPGMIASDSLPSISGNPMVGKQLSATAGTWSHAPESVSYQWRRDGVPIAGATAPEYTAAAADGGHNLSVRVTVGAAGYTTTTAIGEPVRVLHGVASFARQPEVHGRALVGRVLTARPGAVSPSRAATLSYQWFRGSQAIHGAVDRAYELRKRDAGHRLWVRVTIKARDWAAASRRSSPSGVVRLHAR